jgi:hypothetical protein
MGFLAPFRPAKVTWFLPIDLFYRAVSLSNP